MSKKKQLLLGLILILALSIVLASVAFAADPLPGKPDAPEHHKSVTNNGDGTYTIEVDVTGDAEVEVESDAKVNVILVYDVSSSMMDSVSGSSGTNAPNRADQAENAVNAFIKSIASYQSSSDSSNVQMALVTFAQTATIRSFGSGESASNWTSNLTGTGGLISLFDENVNGQPDGNAINLTYENSTFPGGESGHNGTNWQAALDSAATLLQSADGDPTFVVMVTDGAPTASGAAGNTNNGPIKLSCQPSLD